MFWFFPLKINIDDPLFPFRKIDDFYVPLPFASTVCGLFHCRDSFQLSPIFCLSYIRCTKSVWVLRALCSVAHITVISSVFSGSLPFQFSLRTLLLLRDLLLSQVTHSLIPLLVFFFRSQLSQNIKLCISQLSVTQNLRESCVEEKE